MMNWIFYSGVLRGRIKAFTPNNTTEYFVPLSDWMVGMGIDSVTAIVRLNNILSAVGNAVQLRARFAYQTAPMRTNAPTAWVGTGTNITGVTGASPTPGVITATLTSVTNSALMIRFGIAYSASAASADPFEADVELEFTCGVFGAILSQGTYDLAVDAVSANYLERALSEWTPSAPVAKVKIAFIAQNLQGNPEWIFRIRSATNDVNIPNAWGAIGTAYSTAQTDTVISDTATGIAATDFWFQLGVGYRGTAGARSEVTLTVITAMRS